MPTRPNIRMKSVFTCKEYEIAIITVSHDHNLPVSQWPHSPKSLHTRESVTDRILCQAHDKFYSTPLHKGSRALHSSLHLTILSFPIIQNFNSLHSDPHGHGIDCPSTYILRHPFLFPSSNTYIGIGRLQC